MKTFESQMQETVSAISHRAKPRNRAKEFLDRTLTHYEMAGGRLKKNRSVKLMCHVGITEYEVYRVGDRDNDFVFVEGKRSDGSAIITIAPIDQIAFSIITSKKKSDSPLRKIGFAELETVVK